MNDSDAEKYDRAWREMRHKTTGELLKIKFIDGRGNDFTQYIIDMELDRRKMNRDMWVSRWIAFGALSVSILSLVFSLIHKHRKQRLEMPEKQAPASLSIPTNAPHIQTNNPANIYQPVNTNR
jgi:hypothetical protein